MRARKIKALILRTAGTNCDAETYVAFKKVGASPVLLHINQIICKKEEINNYDILVLPGGFSYGDDIAAGKILANEIKYKIFPQIEKFVTSGKPIIGICNGFQVLVKAGLLPGFNGANNAAKQTVTLTFNDSGRFECRWVHLKFNRNTKCKLLQGFPYEIITLPVAHGEGKFFTTQEILQKIKDDNLIVWQYVDENGNLSGYPYNPNGSLENIAGICNEKGNILGMMPHPERFLTEYHHPYWKGMKEKTIPYGYYIFNYIVDYVKRNF
jgi:phosphoribosylformylglycinamidine synthase